ncbi:esterase E4-like [Periplaneta americana]|uniref:esterase E4-like n=1 Tax=Periplaneta americana TaxID=6978 RepID=UPI0037E761AF
MCQVLRAPVAMLVLAVGTVLFILVITITFVREDSWGPHADDPKVDVEQGVLRGVRSITRKGREIVSFLGVPYAAPPVGKLRFRAPRPPDSWLGTRDATQDAPACLQPTSDGADVTGQEDCLYLDVHTPKLPEEDDTLLPVMVWIHGGAYISGSGSSELYKPTYLLDHNVVLVTLNYRLGPLGFLSTGDKILPGNYGLKDQVTALVWVRNNIEEFGGDSESITIFGNSAGSISVHYHMLSPMSRGLFHRAISQSGTAFSPHTLIPIEVLRRRALKVGSLVGCPSRPVTRLAECLRTRNASVITRTLSEFQMWANIPSTIFPPVVESTGVTQFMPDTPFNLVKARRAANIPWLAGIAAHDGCVVSQCIYSDPTDIMQLDKHFDSLVMKTNYMSGQGNFSYMTDVIRKFYFGDSHIDQDAINNVANMYTDSYFLYPLNLSVNLHVAAGNKNVYMYYFNYAGSFNHSMVCGKTVHNYGMCHGDDMLYLFPGNSMSPNLTGTIEDHRMIDIVTTLWTNFARTGNPTDSVSDLIPVSWAPVTMSTGNYLEIGSQLRMHTNLLPLHVRLWRNVYRWVYNIS